MLYRGTTVVHPITLVAISHMAVQRSCVARSCKLLMITSHSAASSEQSQPSHGSPHFDSNPPPLYLWQSPADSPGRLTHNRHAAQATPAGLRAAVATTTSRSAHLHLHAHLHGTLARTQRQGVAGRSRRTLARTQRHPPTRTHTCTYAAPATSARPHLHVRSHRCRCLISAWPHQY